MATVPLDPVGEEVSEPWANQFIVRLAGALGVLRARAEEGPSRLGDADRANLEAVRSRLVSLSAAEIGQALEVLPADEADSVAVWLRSAMGWAESEGLGVGTWLSFAAGDALAGRDIGIRGWPTPRPLPTEPVEPAGPIGAGM
ncbi:MAG: hypothetical protein LBK95_19165 [Bifidobacteriaceae bacterium]|jgi:hypothetical protein|nr:hypothetical protein [Bifidobacteriaceae bacterium]